MGILDFFDDAELVRSFGAMTFERGRAYAAQGRVLSTEVNAANPRITLVSGRVEGSTGRRYATTVTLAEDPSGAWIDAHCTCPVVRMCKHAAAVMAAVQEEQGTGRDVRDWERRLGLVLDELDAAVESSVVDKTPLGLQFELVTGRPSRFSGLEGVPRTHRGLLRVRPVQRGARDNWVRSRVGWSDVPYLDRRVDLDPAQAAVLGELLSAHRAANRQAYFGSESYLSVATFGASVWPLLQEAVRAGVVLVAGPGLTSVRVAEEPVTLTVDVNGVDTARAHLQLGVRFEEVWFGADRLEVLGADGHGVALWTEGSAGADGVRVPGTWELVLAGLTRKAGVQTRRLLALGQTLPVPRDEVPELVADYLPRLQRHLPVTSSDQSLRLDELPEPRLALTVTWKAVDQVHIAWSWRYRVGQDDRVYGLDEGRGLRGVRRIDEETRLLEELVLDEEQTHRLCRAGQRDRGLVPEQTFNGAFAVAFAEDTLRPLEESGQVEVDEIGTRPDYHEVTGAPEVSFQPRHSEGEGGDEPVFAHTDWLDLEVVVTVEGRFIGLAQLLEAMTLGAERIVLRDGAHLRIDRPEFARLTELVRAARELEERQPGDGVRVSKHDLGLWAELAEIGVVDAQASTWVQAARALRDVEGLPDVDPSVSAELRSYQLEGFRWLVLLWQLGLGGVLADDMGLGKTLQTLALIQHARMHGAVGHERAGAPFLVVAPTSVVATWEHEAATFTPDLSVRTVTESRSRRGRSLAELHDGADVVVTSYTLFRLEADEYVALDWGGVVLDEAQMVKNHQGKTYQAVRRLDVPFRLALTGTPMENRLMELWSLLSIVAPGLYPYPDRFAESVANPVEREGDAAALARFRRRIRPFLLRRTKELVASDLPPKQEQVLEVQLTAKHRKVYETHLQRERQNVLGLLGDFDRQRIAIFRSLTRLRQLSLDAGLVDPAYDGIGSAKLNVLVDHLQEVVAEGHRALVFSQFTSFLTRVRQRLDTEGIPSKYLDGRTRKRSEVVGGFKRGEAPVFLISLKAGGVGLTLTEADYVFVLDPWWNPAVEAQAVDRAHRIGQRRPVMVYRLVSSATVEEKVMELKTRKAALFAKVVDGEGGTGTPIDADDIRALFEE